MGARVGRPAEPSHRPSRELQHHEGPRGCEVGLCPCAGRACGLLHPVLGFRCRRRLRRHVAGRVGAATLQWPDVIHNEPRACPGCLAGCRAGMAALECSSGRRVPCGLTVGGAGAGGTLLRRGSSACGGGATCRLAVGARRTPRGAEPELLRLAEPHVGVAASRGQSAMTSFRIVMDDLSAVSSVWRVFLRLWDCLLKP